MGARLAPGLIGGRSKAGTIVALLAVAGIVGAQPSDATFPWTNGRIAFSAYRFVEGDPGALLWRSRTVAPDGSDLRRAAPMQYWDPAWSPDGTRIAWGVGVVGRLGGWLRITTPRGRVLRTVVRFAHREIDVPEWSPSGRRLAFCTLGGDPFAEWLWVVRRDGSHLTRVGRLGDCNPAWSPDGRWLAVENQNFAVAVSGFIAVMRPDGSDRRLVLWHGQNPDWSPDGTQILFSRFRNSQSDLFTMAADASDVERLTDTRKRNEISAAWSPNGKRIAFSSSKESGGEYDLWVLRPADRDRTRLTTTPRWGEISSDWQAR